MNKFYNILVFTVGTTLTLRLCYDHSSEENVYATFWICYLGSYFIHRVDHKYKTSSHKYHHMDIARDDEWYMNPFAAGIYLLPLKKISKRFSFVSPSVCLVYVLEYCMEHKIFYHYYDYLPHKIHHRNDTLEKKEKTMHYGPDFVDYMCGTWSKDAGDYKCTAESRHYMALSVMYKMGRKYMRKMKR